MKTFMDSRILQTVGLSMFCCILSHIQNCCSAIISQPSVNSTDTTYFNDTSTTNSTELPMIATTNYTFKHTCECKIVAKSGKLIHDFGDIHESSNGGSTILPSSLTPKVFACHLAHQRCRTKCASMLNLDQFNSDHHRNGMSYCLDHGSVTSHDGGLDLHAQWRSSGTCRRSLTQRSYHTVRLCCGITFMDILPNSNHQPISVFAWDTDCKGLNFVFGP